ncbi:MAG TPA: ATP-dependent helicase, partial [Streptosporangiaceae bacterium]|nr:ATP-dependent helicase [Streptosporangiaceae bacterium]
MTGRSRYGPAQLARLLGLPEPTSEQAAVIAAPLQPLGVIAGAGSGKSETMAARLVWLVANDLVVPHRVLGLTFTRKAAAELGQRVRARLAGLRRAGLVPGPDGLAAAGAAADGLAADGADVDGLLDGEPVVSTYHAYAARLVADHALREAMEPSLRLITPAVSWQIAARVVASYSGPMDAVDRTPQWVTAAVLDLAAELAEHLRTPGDVEQAGRWLDTASQALAGQVPALVRKIRQCQRTREQLLPIVAAYARAKAVREVLDYGDQIALAARIATAHREVGAIERARYQVVLLDEYQDTSHAQLVLLRALFGGGHPVTAVGDPCQSIYGWRGASAGNLRRFADDFPVIRTAGNGGRASRPRPAGIRMLSTSFRNTENVLDAAAALQAGLRAEAPLVPRLVPSPPRAGRGRVVCALLETAADEAEWVATQVAELLALPSGIAPDGRPWPEPGRAEIRASDVAVLCRKRSQFPALRAALEAGAIAVEVVGLGGLLTVPEVADVVATLRVLHDPTASAPLARLLTGPRWRIGPRDLVALGKRARDLARDQRGRADGPARRDSTVPASTVPASTVPASARPASARPASTGPASTGPASTGPASAGTASTGTASTGTAGRSGHEPHQPGEPGEPPSSVKHHDPLALAVTDLTADRGSLVEALDDLGPAAGYSAAGYARFGALAAELRTLRTHTGRPLPDLVGEVERVLGLDVEVAAQPWRDPVAARADLDAFADAAAAFADDEEEPTLGAFLAYLTAAEAEEFGLESGQPSGTDAVILTTVHAAKGLQWPAVVVPGLAAGAKARVFPARSVASTRWTENPRLLPFGLRGDAGDLPALADLSAPSLAAFGDACSARELAEERRLAYVAVTRAAYWVACSGYWWGDGVSPLGPSVFLDEVRAACQAGAGTVARWAPPPADDATNPVLAGPISVRWPPSPAGARHAAVAEAAALVGQARARLRAGGPGTGGAAGLDGAAGPDGAAAGARSAGAAGPDGAAAGARSAGEPAGADGALGAGDISSPLTAGDLMLAEAWARDTELLL